MQLFCLTKFQYEDVTSVHTETFMECVTACDNYKIPVGGTDQRPCIAVTFTEPINNPGRNCYLKGSIHEVIYGRTRFSSAKKVSYPVPADIQVAVVELPFSTASALLPKPTRPIEPVDPCPVSYNAQ